MRTQEQVNEIVRRLLAEYPEAVCSLDYVKDYELLFSVRLSAQCTDERVNMVTPALFERYPTLQSFAEADVAEVEQYVHSCGFYHAKARDIVNCAIVLLEKHGGRVPDTMEELVKLPGVGRKTANLLLGDLYRVPGSVARERARRKQLPPESSSDFCHCIVLHGRAVCDARSPRCEQCCLRDLCQAYEQGTVNQRIRKA